MGQNYFEMNLDKVIGLAYWGAIDYLGESQGWPAKGWAQGVFAIDLEAKPKAYYMKSFFCPDTPVVHIAVIDKKGDQMWNGVQTGNDGMSDHWNRVAGQRLQLITYTNADEVELVLNGKSLGIKKNNLQDAKMRNQIRWSDIDWQPGYLEAIARNEGRVVARHRIETTGEATKLMAEPDNAEWKSDGMDLQHVRIMAVDKKGRRVQTTDQEVTFAIEGDAKIVGVVNGDINSNEMMVGTKRCLYNGTCTAILRAGRTGGPITLTASAPGMKSITVKLKTTE
jgi:beta-galactosidase